MKNIILSFVLVVAMIAIAADAASAAEKARYGLKVGLNFANLTGDFEQEFWASKARIAPVIGGYAVIKLKDYMFVQPEILLSYKGAKIAEEKYRDEISLSYIDIPIFLKFSIPTSIGLRPNLFFGPAANLLTGSEYISGKFKYELEDESSNFDVSAIIGVGVDIASGKGVFVFEGRYTIGFITIDDRRPPSDIFNRVFTVMTGYTF
jgi:hypothetical protein